MTTALWEKNSLIRLVSFVDSPIQNTHSDAMPMEMTQFSAPRICLTTMKIVRSIPLIKFLEYVAHRRHLDLDLSSISSLGNNSSSRKAKGRSASGTNRPRFSCGTAKPSSTTSPSATRQSAFPILKDQRVTPVASQMGGRSRWALVKAQWSVSSSWRRYFLLSRGCRKETRSSARRGSMSSVSSS